MKKFGFTPRKNPGFTMVEVIVVTALFAILMVLVGGIFLYNNRFYENQTGKISGVNATREAADRLNEYARLAISFENSYVYNAVTYTTASSTAIFKLASIEADNDVIIGVYDYAIFGKDPSNSDQLRLIVVPHGSSARPARDLLLSDKLTYINLVYDNVDLAQATSVTYEMRVREGGRHPVTEEVFGTATLRN